MKRTPLSLRPFPLAPGHRSLSGTVASLATFALLIHANPAAAGDGGDGFTASSVAGTILCHGGTTTVTVSADGGSPPYTGVGTFTVGAGPYSFTVTDAEGLTSQTTGTISEPSALTAALSKTDVRCNGASIGAINLTVSGGTTPYSFAWNNGATTEDLSALPAGNYSVIVTDANGCTTTASATLTEPAALSASLSKTDVTCHGASTGAVNLTVSGGVAPYTFAWSHGATTEDLSALPAGNYSVTVTDAKGCIASASVTLVAPPPLAASLAKTDPSCQGTGTGAINLTVAGGTAPYTFAWSNGATTEDLSALPGGAYSVTVTDANGCTTTASVTLVEPSTLAASLAKTDPRCHGGNTGALNLTVSGGTAPYTFAWSNGATTEDLPALAAGNYSVTVTDANGCTASASATLTEPAVLSASLAKTDPSCHGTATGSLNLTVTGGTAPYTFTWSNGATTKDLSALAAGNYSVNVTDANGCTTTTAATVVAPPQLVLQGTTQNAQCAGAATGSIDLTVTGGTAPYSYLWTHGATTQDASALFAGDYRVTVTDAQGCSAQANFTITQPSGLSLTETHVNPVCFGAVTGSIDLTVAGGQPPYTYAWSSGASTEDLGGVPAGDYTVTVTDQSSCSAQLRISISQPGPLTLSFATTDTPCRGSTVGTIDLTVTGGTAPYTYAWSTSATTEDLAGLDAGTYTVRVTDANGCSASSSATVQRQVCDNSPTGLWIGEVSLGAVSYPATGAIAPASSSAQMRLLLHVDAAGTVRLLKDIVIAAKSTRAPTGTSASDNVALITRPTLLSSLPLLRDASRSVVGRRYSTVSYDFTDGDTNPSDAALEMAGGLGQNLECTGTLRLDPGHPTNPFRHKFHPDHANVGTRAYAITRNIKVRITSPMQNVAGLDQLAGTYEETVTGLNRDALTTRGTLILSRVTSVGVLNQ